MYCSSGNYAVFARPEKPDGVERKSAYIIGSGLAGLTAAFYLLRDAQMKGEHIHLLERRLLPGGSASLGKDAPGGFFICGGRCADEHFEVMWDVFRDVPSACAPGESVLDEYFRLNRRDPNSSLCRATADRGRDAHTNGKFTLDRESELALSRLLITPESELEGKTISQVMPESFWRTNFWLYWQSEFAFQRRSGALEMKRCLRRYADEADSLPDLRGLRFGRYERYESMILPLVSYLEAHGVKTEYGMDVKNVVIDTDGDRRLARQIVYIKDGTEQTIDLIEDDLVFVANGCMTDSAVFGGQTHAPDTAGEGGESAWALWRAIAAQAKSGEFGAPEAFCTGTETTGRLCAAIAVSDGEIIRHITDICRRDPRLGKTATGGMIAVRDSADGWCISWGADRQPRYRRQNKNEVLVWLHALEPEKPGSYVKKAARLCTGEEVCREWLFHIGVPEERIEALAADGCRTAVCFMPHAGAVLGPRRRGDRPPVVPEGSVNLAFIGQFAETPDEAAFSAEYSMRTGMEAVYTLLGVDRGVPEVRGSGRDVRRLLRAVFCVLDKKPVTDMKLGLKERELVRAAVKKLKGTDIELLLKESGLLR